MCRAVASWQAARKAAAEEANNLASLETYKGSFGMRWAILILSSFVSPCPQYSI